MNNSDERDNAEEFEFGTGDLPVYQAVRLGLQRLGHVEFFSSTAGADWRVVPAAMAINRVNDTSFVGILCGARPPDLRQHLNASNKLASWDATEQSGLPDRIRVFASSADELTDVATSLSFLSQLDAPESLLAAIPPVDDARSRVPAEPPLTPGWDIHRFSPESLSWKVADAGDLTRVRTGLFRLRMRFQQFYFLKWHRRFFSTHVQVGKYAVLHDRRIRRLVEFSPHSHTLSVPVTCRPPLLVERALVLCSGCLPTLVPGSARLQYSCVSRSVARLASGLLRQELQIR